VRIDLRLWQQQVIASHHESVDIVMVARDAPKMQIDRPAAAKVEGCAQISERFCDFK